MGKKVRMTLLCAAIAVAGSGVVLQGAAGAPSDGKRFDATFTESAVSITNRIGDLGVFQLINTGNGTVEGFGAATLVISITQDRSVQPCGPGSWTNVAIRRIVLDDGVLILRALAYACQTASGPAVTGTWKVDGPSSTGIFAGARGSGRESVDLTTRVSTLSGKLKLAG